jgi:predicted GNAT superfamily acetyltransferase
MRFENLTTLDQFREVERLEGEIWGPIDLVPVPIMAVSVRRGAVLVGAYDGPRLAGFVYSFPAIRGHEGHKGDTGVRRPELQFGQVRRPELQFGQVEYVGPNFSSGGSST